MRLGKKMLRAAFLTLVGMVGVLAIGGKNGPRDDLAADVTYTTSCCQFRANCEQAHFAFEPFPALNQPGISTPSEPMRNTGVQCLSPGAQFEIHGLRRRYGDMGRYGAIDLVIYRTRVVEGPDGNKSWDGRQDPHFIRLSSTEEAGTVESSVPEDLNGIPPAAVDIRVTYKTRAGDNRQVFLEADRDPSEHRLFFYPDYSVSLATKEISIGYDLFGRTLTGLTMLHFSAFYPRGWERFCQMYNASISDLEFPGTVKFMEPAPTRYNPLHGYHIEMPGGTSGQFEFQYLVVCPKGMKPSGNTNSSDWQDLGDYTSYSRISNLPTYMSVNFPWDSWHPSDSPYN